MALENAQFIGLDDIEFYASGSVLYNKAKQIGSSGLEPNERINWAVATDITNDPESLIPVFSENLTDIISLQVSGDAALNASVFTVLAGTFELTKQSDVKINDGRIAAFQADVLSVSLTASGFVGVGGALSEPNSSTSTVVTTNATGFNVSSSSVDLVLVQDRTYPTNKYNGFQASLTNAGLVGFEDDFSLTVSGQAEISRGSAAGRLDWSAVAGEGNELPAVGLTMDEPVAGEWQRSWTFWFRCTGWYG